MCYFVDPSRWREVVQCRTDDRLGQKTFKTVILETCNERGDCKANDICMRVLEATSDLHAADVQYHKDCYVNIMPTQNT